MELINTNLQTFEELINNDKFDFNYLSKNENDTQDLAFSLCKFLKNSDIIVLNGELGSGKTSFMQGVAKYFNIQDQICSPTFTIVNEYTTSKHQNIFHFDVYRLNDEIEFLDQIGTDYFSKGISFIEWGDIIQNILPKNTIHIDISKDLNESNTRHIHIWRQNYEHISS